MTCPHLCSGRCLLSEKLAADELGVQLECPTTEVQCGRCLPKGPTEERPTSQVLGNVMQVCPKGKGRQWREFSRYKLAGVPRGRGDVVQKALKHPILKPFATVAKKALAAVNGGDCGCAARQKRLNEKFPAQSLNHSSAASAQEKPV
jgi:hypothetical protein